MINLSLLSFNLKIKKVSGPFSLLIFLIFFSCPFTWAANSDSIKEKKTSRGKKAYLRFCSMCHGKKGLGDGPGAYKIGIPPRDLTYKAYMSLFTDEELMKRIKYGENAFPYLQMPPISDRISDKTIWDIVSYVRSLGVDKGPLKEPTPKERAEKFEKDAMERGRIYYLRYCSPCHGVTGDGKGWKAQFIDRNPVDHTDPVHMAKFTRQDIYDHVVGIRKKKDRQMPVFETPALIPEIVKLIAAYTKSLSQNSHK